MDIEQEFVKFIEEAVLVNRDYKYDSGKGEIHISKKNFKKVPKDYKNDTPGKETMITYDSKWGTVSVPVKFTEEKDQQNSIGEDKMEKLVDTVRKVLVGEGEGDQAEYQKKRKAVAKKFGVESCSALKDEAKRKECYNALDKAHVADHEEQVYLHNMNKKEEVEVKKKVTEGVDLKKLKKEYDKNEDKNNHTENYLLLAKAFGSSSDVKKVQEIMKRNQKQGSTSKSDMDWMYKNINPYYDKIRNEEVEMDESPKPPKSATAAIKKQMAGYEKMSLSQLKKERKDTEKALGREDRGSYAYDEYDNDLDIIDIVLKKKMKKEEIEEVKVEKTISKLFSHVRKLMSK